MRVLSAIGAAAILVAVVLTLANRDPDPPQRTAHVAIAPGASVKRPDGRVAGTTLTAQQAADAALEDGVHPDLVPLSEADFRAPIARYRTYAVRQARGLQRAAAELTRVSGAGGASGAAGATRAGAVSGVGATGGSGAGRASGTVGASGAGRPSRAVRVAAARRAWAEAFDRWLLVGAAYGALGDVDAQITDALDAVRRHPLDARAARSLRDGAGKLPAALRAAELVPADYAIRAHEILEDVQRDRLGDATGVRATADGVAATRTVLRTLHGLLAGRGDTLQQVDARLTQLEATLNEIRRAHGAWPATQALGHAERQRLSGQLGAALEALAGVPGALETQVPPPIPELR